MAVDGDTDSSGSGETMPMVVDSNDTSTTLPLAIPRRDKVVVSAISGSRYTVSNIIRRHGCGGGVALRRVKPVSGIGSAAFVIGCFVPLVFGRNPVSFPFSYFHKMPHLFLR